MNYLLTSYFETFKFYNRQKRDSLGLASRFFLYSKITELKKKNPYKLARNAKHLFSIHIYN